MTATRWRRLLADVADSFLANGGSGRPPARLQIEPPGDRAGAELRGRRARRGLAKNDIRGLRRAFSLTFRAGLYPLSGRRRADRQPSGPLAPPAGRRRRFLFGECRIGAVGCAALRWRRASRGVTKTCV